MADTAQALDKSELVKVRRLLDEPTYRERQRNGSGRFGGRGWQTVPIRTAV